MKILPILSRDGYIKYYPWIKECNFTEIAPEIVLANCLTNKYFGYIGLDKDEVVGMVICEDCGERVFIVGLWAKNVLKYFIEDFWKRMKKKGFKKARSATNLNSKAYQKLLGMKPLWTVYEKEL